MSRRTMTRSKASRLANPALLELVADIAEPERRAVELVLMRGHSVRWTAQGGAVGRAR